MDFFQAFARVSLRFFLSIFLEGKTPTHHKKNLRLETTPGRRRVVLAAAHGKPAFFLPPSKRRHAACKRKEDWMSLPVEILLPSFLLEVF